MSTADTSWLDPVRAALDTRSTPTAAFVRDDDAGWGHDHLAALVSTAGGHGVVIDLAVIPDALDDAVAADLVRWTESGHVRLHQHGRCHANHELEGRACEFGPGRSRHDQQLDLLHGSRRLAAQLGPLVDPVFTPPWNRCTAVTAELLAELGWRVLSRDHTAERFGRPDLIEIPVTFDWFGKTGGRPWGPIERAERLASSLADSEGAATGIMLHHAVTDPEGLAAIDQLLALLATHPMVRLTSLADLAAAVAG
ncbi:MAG: hypothetical protein R2761_31815 [Acidimicrobiales bacterium]